MTKDEFIAMLDNKEVIDKLEEVLEPFVTHEIDSSIDESNQSSE